MQTHSSSHANAGAAGSKATRVRWGILAILFLVTTINYADRATISIAGPEIKKLLGLSPVEMGFVFSAFAWSYVLAQLPGGWLLDRFGSKITYFFSIFLWSVFTMLMGTVGFLSGGAAVATLFALRLHEGRMWFAWCLLIYYRRNLLAPCALCAGCSCAVEGSCRHQSSDNLRRSIISTIRKRNRLFAPIFC